MVQYCLNGYLRDLPFESSVKQSNKKTTAHELHIYHHDVIDSTMNICEKIPHAYITDKHCYAFIADCQKNGQGQHSNTWSSPPGNLYVSFLVKTKPLICSFSAQLAAVSTFQVIEELAKEQGCS